jgi:nitrous oxide reductase
LIVIAAYNLYSVNSLICVVFLETKMEKTQALSSRRGLLFGTAAVGAVAATVAALPAIKATEATASLPKPAPEKGGGYSVSEHVKHYYRTALV